MTNETVERPKDEQVDVVIIGAGPVGLATALQLGRLGIATRVFERRRDLSRHPRPAASMRAHGRSSVAGASPTRYANLVAASAHGVLDRCQIPASLRPSALKWLLSVNEIGVGHDEMQNGRRLAMVGVTMRYIGLEYDRVSFSQNLRSFAACRDFNLAMHNNQAFNCPWRMRL